MTSRPQMGFDDTLPMAPGRCVLCGHPSHPVKAASRTSLLAEYRRMFNLTFPPEVLASNFAFDTIKMYECRHCGTRSYDPMIEGDAAYYRHLSTNLRWYYETDRWEFRPALDILEKAGARQFLEVGCGDGHFLSLAARQGLTGAGLEINPEAVAKLKSRGLEVRTELNERDGPYDAIVMFQLIEHLKDPFSYLTSILPHLRKHGLLVLSTPVTPSCAAFNSNAFLWPPHHQWLPTTRAYRHLAARLQLHCEHIICDPPAVYQVQYAIKKWFGSFPFAKHWRIAALEEELARLVLRTATVLRREWATVGHTALVVLRNESSL